MGKISLHVKEKMILLLSLGQEQESRKVMVLLLGHYERRTKFSSLIGGTWAPSRMRPLMTGQEYAISVMVECE